MIKIEKKDGNIGIFTPYNSDFVKAIKKIGEAKWDSSNKCWVVPEEFIEVVRNILMDVYGYTDISENETITLKVTFNEEAVAEREDVVLFSKIIAHAYGRDSGAKVGDDVALQSGSVASGGSSKYWCSIVREGSVAILKRVNKNIYEKEKDTIPYNVTIEEIESKLNKMELIEEKNRLLARVAEIDKLLEGFE